MTVTIMTVPVMSHLRAALTGGRASGAADAEPPGAGEDAGAGARPASSGLDIPARIEEAPRAGNLEAAPGRAILARPMPAPGPLDGIRVVDLTRVLAGPFCTLLLADLGADVIKVETPEGDPVRRQGAVREGLSWYFAAFNRNKRSVVLDLRRPGGRGLLERLLGTADVLVENFRPGVLEDMGLAPEGLRARHPALVCCRISGYGQTGPYRDRPAFDFIAQAMSGFMSVNGVEGGPPLRSGLPVSDLVAGLYAALGVTAALARRARTGRGDVVDTAMMDGLVSFTAYLGAECLATGAVPPRTGNDHPIVAPYGLFAASDGDIAIAPANDQVYERLLEALELGELRDHPDFATNALRVRHRARINALVGARIALGTRQHWIERLNRAGVPCGRVLSLPEAFADPQTAAREMVLEVEHPGHGPVRMPGFPVKLAEAPCRVRRPAPALGAHTDEVLAELGLDAAERAALRRDGVTG
jgi:crotonobetainyl-CoA:carnitine CoA-transferase CaiB-like acyl-CoA transferase